MKYLERILAVGATCLLAACAATNPGGHAPSIDGIEIVNRSSSDIESFRLAVPRDGIVVTANRLAQGSRSLNKVEPFRYRHNNANLRWFQDGVKYTMEGLKLDHEVESADAMTVVIELGDKGEAATRRR
ncbi:hypothetical protein [Coraliomargarita sinensis]|uniref:hypothetical protein n=1 Tax=Coraliomargarita sinensis TaxID=2174842 RepID=UPI001E4E741C|nr:hypothetical protein [Coraliomargarita sinensis]